MQIRLIEFVRTEAPRVVCADYHLEKVWYSNQTDVATDPQDHPLDVTCQHLTAMLQSVKYWLPPFEGVLLTRGWSPLPLSYVARRIRTRQDGTDDDDDDDDAGAGAGAGPGGHRRPFPRHPGDAEEPPAFVWLPPRGVAATGGTAAAAAAAAAGRFRCYNDLYEAAYRSRAKDEACREFRHSYRPTLQWYEEQRREGRHCTHVCVDAGDRIVDRLPRTKSGSKPR